MLKENRRFIELKKVIQFAIVIIGIVLSIVVIKPNFEKLIASTNMFDFIFYYFDNMYFMLVWLPILVIVSISGDSFSARYRYPILLRYWSKGQFVGKIIVYNVKVVIGFLSIIILNLVILSLFYGFTISSKKMYIQHNMVSIMMVYKLLNTMSYFMMVSSIHSLLELFFNNAIVVSFLTMAIPLLNLLIIKSFRGAILFITPWGNMAYKLYGQVLKSYSFYWGYWLATAVILYFLYDLALKRDVVYEKEKKLD